MCSTFDEYISTDSARTTLFTIFKVFRHKPNTHTFGSLSFSFVCETTLSHVIFTKRGGGKAQATLLNDKWNWKCRGNPLQTRSHVQSFALCFFSSWFLFSLLYFMCYFVLLNSITLSDSIVRSLISLFIHVL